ncbi:MULTISPECIES: 3-hydroxyacyl-CoA dehydrogenase NAD-binding domain-containing protein [unclassified Pseudofrankia]|uniref:3-hydroxyacyl-CoA dehydrogenase NAD-binding domain-containing protein n=1 Tax=unclassified Pseudofrankia TaxID=2994372 RepID=UPI0008DB3118|nr:MULTISPECIES: 3-hydroxyacyl-CoA dehydrogenase NAD-binding domain-containing protein [unclassified Pseudofrankia]MDT3444822.1 3-hydroxyacyl-CoA dehydrogenase NAD-binding domain-containing protein [Pseudofrankia sp. BMG5.37]OHV45152.1 3-hydroxyacyl-CoA dehydrogenase [Pseudofrankia sp. BMG5.36]
MSSTDVALDFPDEVVTHAYVRYAQLPGVDGPVALITLDNGHDHTRPNTFGPAGLRELLAAVDEIEAHTPPVAAVAVTGKPFIFCVGADLSFRSSFTDPDAIRPAIEKLGELGHMALRRVGEGRLAGRKVPTFALVNGAAMGGGLELALHCDYRAFSAGIPVLALPEVFLGLVPGWGGTQLLPNLVGADKAVTLAIENPLNTNRTLKGPQAAKLGLADVLLEPADFLEEALAWVGQVLRGLGQSPRRTYQIADLPDRLRRSGRDPVADPAGTPDGEASRGRRLSDDIVDPVAARPAVERGQAWTDALARGRALADAKLHGAAPAAYRALELLALAETADRDAGYAAETTALADLSVSEELAASLYAFDLTQKRARKPVGGPDPKVARPVSKVGVVGAGLMASQLALLFAQRLEVPVVLTDLDQARLDKGVGYVHREVDNLLLRGRVSHDKANRLKALVTGSLTKEAFADADLVIEAVFEDLKVKQAVLGELEAVVRPDALLLTNTSALSVTDMAAGLAHPERVAGLHFFNPVAVLPLVEVVRAARTDDAAVATTLAVAKKLGKNAVLVKDAPAFVVNRLLTRFLGEVLGAIEEGTPVAEADAALDPLGLPMSPLTLLALVGPPVALHVAETLHDAFPDRFRSPTGLGRVVAAGKTSVYTTGPDGAQIVDAEAAALARGPVAGDGASAGSALAPSGEEVRASALSALAQEIRLLLDEGVVAEAADIDLCMILGAGWPFHLGGITPYLDRIGVSEKIAGARFTPPGVATVR